MYNIEDGASQEEREKFHNLAYTNKVIPTIFMLYLSMYNLPSSTVNSLHVIDTFKAAKMRIKESIFWLTQDDRFSWRSLSEEEKDELLSKSFDNAKNILSTYDDKMNDLGSFDSFTIRRVKELLKNA